MYTLSARQRNFAELIAKANGPDQCQQLETTAAWRAGKNNVIFGYAIGASGR